MAKKDDEVGLTSSDGSKIRQALRDMKRQHDEHLRDAEALDKAWRAWDLRDLQRMEVLTKRDTDRLKAIFEEEDFDTDTAWAGEKIKSAIQFHYGEAHDLQEQIEDIEAAWDTGDRKSLVNMGILRKAGDQSLRKALIRVAYENPSLRKDVLPLLKQ